MRWLDIKTKDELVVLSKIYSKSPFVNIRLEIKKDLESLIKKHGYKEKTSLEIFKITSGTWTGLFNKIVIFRDILYSLNKTNTKASNTILIQSNSEINYFKSEEDALIFYILEMDGKKRSEKLGITRNCFVNKSAAKKWRAKISLKIHPDKTQNKNATKAAAKLNQLYSEMIGDE